MNYAKNKARKLVDKFRKIEIYDKDSNTTLIERNSLLVSKKLAVMDCKNTIKALDEIDCNEHENVMENINMEQRFYNDVIDEIEKL